MKQNTYVELIAVKQWADRGMCEAIRQNFDRLSKEDQASMLRVVDHIHAVDTIFKHHFLGRPHGYRAARSESLPELDTLLKGIEQLDDWYMSYVPTLNDSDFEETVDFVFTSGKQVRMRRREMILHVCQHGTYHRGNAGMLLRLRGLVPGRETIADFLEDAA